MKGDIIYHSMKTEKEGDPAGSYVLGCACACMELHRPNSGPVADDSCLSLQAKGLAALDYFLQIWSLQRWHSQVKRRQETRMILTRRKTAEN